jgi:hypothetical protein
VRVLAADEDPAAALGEPSEDATPDAGTAADWLPGIRDAHDDEDAGGWQAAWLDRPTWDPTIAPNIKGRTGGKGRRSQRGRP